MTTKILCVACECVQLTYNELVPFLFSSRRWHWSLVDAVRGLQAVQPN